MKVLGGSAWNALSLLLVAAPKHHARVYTSPRFIIFQTRLTHISSAIEAVLTVLLVSPHDGKHFVCSFHDFSANVVDE